MDTHEQAEANSATSTADHGSVPLDLLLRFMTAQDEAIIAGVQRLEGQRPDVLTPSTEITRHAGSIGKLAGRREALEELATALKDEGVLIPHQATPEEAE